MIINLILDFVKLFIKMILRNIKKIEVNNYQKNPGNPEKNPVLLYPLFLPFLVGLP